MECVDGSNEGNHIKYFRRKLHLALRRHLRDVEWKRPVQIEFNTLLREKLEHEIIIFNVNS